jgi:hypothetical protein
MAHIYSESSYDDHFCLKPPVLLWLAALYLSRTFVLLVIYIVSSMSLARFNPQAVAALRGTVTIYAFIPSLVAAPVLYAMLCRAPSSGNFVRWLWSHGRTLLILAAIADAGVSINGSGIVSGDVVDLNAGFLVMVLFDAYFLVYIFATRRIRDVFADFPPPAPPTRRRRRR